MKRHAVHTVLAAALVLSAAVAGGASPAGASSIPSPATDPFYAAPANLAAVAPGTVLRSRAVQLTTFGVFPLNIQAWQLLYRSTTYDGQPQAVATTVLLPGSGKPRGLVSYQIAEDAGAPQCAPSFVLRQGSGSVEPINQAEGLLIDAVAAQGFAVSVPDYEGPNGDFGAPRQPGYAVLDGVRAAESFSPLNLDGVNTPVGIWGYSGGSLASGWTAQVQPTYAPELNVRGVAVGGFVTSLQQAFVQINGGFGSGLIFAVLGHLEATSPGIAAALDTYATPAGKAAIAKGATQCELANVSAHPFTDVSKYLTISLKQLLAIPTVNSAIDQLNLGGTTPTAPMFVYHAVHDELIPVAGADATVAKYCAAGAAVTYTRDELSEHGVLAFTGAPSALSWLTQQLTTSTAAHGCTKKTVLTMALSPSAINPLATILIANALALLNLPFSAF